MKDHYVYRYADPGRGDGRDEARCPSSDNGTNWTNASGTPMAMPFQIYHVPFTDNGSSTRSPHGADRRATTRGRARSAPHPFRVSADGNTCAIIAGKTTTDTGNPSTGSYPSPNIMQYHVWVDQGAGAIRLSSTHAPDPRGRRAGLPAVRGPLGLQLLARTGGVGQYRHVDGPDDAARDLGRRAEGRGGRERHEAQLGDVMASTPHPPTPATATRPTGTTTRRTSTPTPRAAPGRGGRATAVAP